VLTGLPASRQSFSVVLLHGYRAPTPHVERLTTPFLYRALPLPPARTVYNVHTMTDAVKHTITSVGNTLIYTLIVDLNQRVSYLLHIAPVRVRCSVESALLPRLVTRCVPSVPARA